MKNIINKIKQHYNIIAGVIALIYVLINDFAIYAIIDIFKGSFGYDVLTFIGFLIVVLTMFLIKYDKCVIIGFIIFILRDIRTIFPFLWGLNDNYFSIIITIATIIIYILIILGILKKNIIKKYYFSLIIGNIVLSLSWVFYSCLIDYKYFKVVKYRTLIHSMFEASTGIIFGAGLISCIILYFRDKYTSKN